MSVLPTGTVTFLFTDIQGSTRLWEESPDAMSLSLARHDLVLRSAIEVHGGVVFKTVGDAFCAAFPTAIAALEAVLAGEPGLRESAVSAVETAHHLSLRVRMAVHTGSAEQRDGDYFGPAVNRVARLLSAGHGGQVLLSLATAEMVRDSLPQGAALLDLGTHRLKDLLRAETIFQLKHPDLLVDFPPLRSLDNPSLPNNLPQQVTSFVGRRKEMDQVKRLLEATRLLTLTGSGGCGKTRLSLQVAAELLDGEGDGVWLVELASVSDPALVPQSVAAVMGVKEEGGKPLLQRLVDSLKSRRLLLILDNCEHLRSACADLADVLIRSCPDVKILASSREALGIAGETTYRIPALSLPSHSEPSTPESVTHYEAVRLFIERAAAIYPDFTVTNANAPAVAQVCHRLDGIPLALELAAARVRVLPIEQIASRLDDRFRLLTGGSRTALPRQQTLRALIDWSYDLLDAQEKALFCQLSVFTGGCTLEAAQAVSAGDGIEEWECLDLMTQLVDKSLVSYEDQDGHGRYHLLESVRQYAYERLAESGQDEAIADLHAGFFLCLVEEAEPHMVFSDRGEHMAWAARLDADHGNLRAALKRFLHRPGGSAMALRMAGAMYRFWFARGYLTEGRAHLDRVFAAQESATPSPELAKAYDGAGQLARLQGDYVAAKSIYEELLPGARLL